MILFLIRRFQVSGEAIFSSQQGAAPAPRQGLVSSGTLAYFFQHWEFLSVSPMYYYLVPVLVHTLNSLLNCTYLFFLLSVSDVCRGSWTTGMLWRTSSSKRRRRWRRMAGIAKARMPDRRSAQSWPSSNPLPADCVGTFWCSCTANLMLCWRLSSRKPPWSTSFRDSFVFWSRESLTSLWSHLHIKTSTLQMWSSGFPTTSRMTKSCS